MKIFKHSHHHICCWLLRFSVLIPFIHLLMHTVLPWFGISIPHSEMVSFIP